MKMVIYAQEMLLKNQGRKVGLLKETKVSLGDFLVKTGLPLLRKSPIAQNIEENVGFFNQFGTYITI